MEELYSDKLWKVVRESAPLPDGGEKQITRLYRPDGVHIIALTENGKILLLKEFRPFYGTYIYMLPSGRVDKENDHREGAQRELREETGFRAEKLEHFCSARQSESMEFENHVYVASGLVNDPLPQDEDERIEVMECSLVDTILLVHGSAKVHLPSAYALLRYAFERPRI